MSTTTQFAEKRFSPNRCLTPTGAFSCSTSIFLKVSASLRRFNKSLPSWCSCLEQNFRHKILKLRFIRLHAPPCLIFSPQSLLWETFENEASHPRLWREKRTATYIFSGLVSLCFTSFIKLVKRHFFFTYWSLRWLRVHSDLRWVSIRLFGVSGALRSFGANGS